MAHVTAGVAKNARQRAERCLTSRTFEDMTGMMAVLIGEMTFHTQVVVLASDASDEILFWQNCKSQLEKSSGISVMALTLDAGVAGPCGLLGLKLDGLALFGESTWHFLFSFRLWHRTYLLGCAINNDALPDESLHHPVVRTWAVNTTLNTLLAQIIVAIIADAAVEVNVLHGFTAVIAEDHPGSRGESLLGSIFFGPEGQVGWTSQIFAG